MRMIERGQHLRFAREAREPLGIAGKEIGEGFDRDVAIQFCVARPIHLAHAADADRGEDLIRAEASSCGEAHVSYFAPSTSLYLRVPESWMAATATRPQSFCC